MINFNRSRFNKETSSQALKLFTARALSLGVHSLYLSITFSLSIYLVDTEFNPRAAAAALPSKDSFKRESSNKSCFNPNRLKVASTLTATQETREFLIPRRVCLCWRNDSSRSLLLCTAVLLSSTHAYVTLPFCTEKLVRKLHEIVKSSMSHPQQQQKSKRAEEEEEVKYYIVLESLPSADSSAVPLQ